MSGMGVQGCVGFQVGCRCLEGVGVKGLVM